MVIAYSGIFDLSDVKCKRIRGSKSNFFLHFECHLIEYQDVSLDVSCLANFLFGNIELI